LKNKTLKTSKSKSFIYTKLEQNPNLQHGVS